MNLKRYRVLFTKLVPKDASNPWFYDAEFVTLMLFVTASCDKEAALKSFEIVRALPLEVHADNHCDSWECVQDTIAAEFGDWRGVARGYNHADQMFKDLGFAYLLVPVPLTGENLPLEKLEGPETDGATGPTQV